MIVFHFMHIKQHKHVLLHQQLFRQWDLNSLEWSGCKAYVWKCSGNTTACSLLTPNCAGSGSLWVRFAKVTFWMSCECMATLDLWNLAWKRIKVEAQWWDLFDAICDARIFYKTSGWVVLKYLYFYSFSWALFFFYLFVDLSITLSLIFLNDDLPRSQTVPVWEPPGCVLKHLIQGVQSRLQWCHQLFNCAHPSVGSLRASRQWVCLRPLGSVLLWAIDAPISWCGNPAEDAGGQKGDESVEWHDAVKEEQQQRVQVLLQLHLSHFLSFVELDSYSLTSCSSSCKFLKVNDNLLSVTTQKISDRTKTTTPYIRCNKVTFHYHSWDLKQKEKSKARRGVIHSDPNMKVNKEHGRKYQ